MNTIKKIAGTLAVFLKKNGTTKIFGVPGENPYTFPALKKNDIEVIVCHHETHAAIAAAHSTIPWDIPGVCYATIGPGATNFVTGISTCLLDEIPLICLVETSLRKSISNTHQVISQFELFNPIVKAYFLISSDGEIENILSAAFEESIKPPFGPVVIGIPVRENLPSMHWYNPNYITGNENENQYNEITINSLKKISKTCNKENHRTIFIIGPRTPYLTIDVINEMRKIPNSLILTTLMGKRAFSEKNLGCNGYVDNEEVYSYASKGIAIEDFFNTDVTTVAININPSEWLLPERITKNELSNHIYINPYANDSQIKELGSKGWKTLIGDPNVIIQQFLHEIIKYDNATDIINYGKNYHFTDPFPIVNSFTKFLNDSGIITIDVGLIKRQVCRIVKSCKENQIFLSNGFSTLGSQLPAATGIALSRIGQKVICYIGDGGFLMACSELATIMNYNLSVLIIISVNESYGQLRDKQFRYSSFCYGTNFLVPNLSLLAKSFNFAFIHTQTLQQLFDEITNFSNDPKPTIIQINSD